MSRTWAILLTVAALAGCRSSQPATNPFMRTTVAPPATGQGAVVVQGEQYYPGATPQGEPLMSPQTLAPPAFNQGPAPGMSAPMATPMSPQAPSSNRYAPPGGSFQYNQSKAEKRSTPVEDEPEEILAWADDAERRTAQKSPAERLAPRGTNTVRDAIALADDPSQLQAFEMDDDDDTSAAVQLVAEQTNTVRMLPTRVTEREELLAARPTLRVTADDYAPDEEDDLEDASGRTRARQTGDGHVRWASMTSKPGVKPAAESMQAEPKSSTLKSSAGAPLARFVPRGAEGDYAFAADYATLRGRLEYSQSTRQWKLRYIPIDGETDQFGGSVVLPNTADLAAFKSGQLVSVRGALASQATSIGSYSPAYRVDAIEHASH